MDDDQRSLFENDDTDLSDPINLTQLTHAVSEYLQQLCQLKKLGEGSYHKVSFGLYLIRWFFDTEQGV